MPNSTEKHAKLKIKILKLLPKLAKAVNFQNPPYSPCKPHASSKMLSIIPVEARRKAKTAGQSFESQEPSSPKVSCMGRIKHQKNNCRKARKKLALPARIPLLPQLAPTPKKRVSAVRRSLSSRTARNSEFECGDDYCQMKLSNEAPSLSQMKSLSSGRRDCFADFDWSAQVRPVDSEVWSSYSDEDGERCEGKEEKTIISFSAPLVGGKELQPRKEVNLWKRRTMAPPRTLQLNA